MVKIRSELDSILVASLWVRALYWALNFIRISFPSEEILTHFLSKTRISVTAAAMAIILSGCSVSPAVDVVSWTVDGFSYLLTGKGMIDHTMSAASKKDCSWARVVKGNTYCVANDDDVAGDRLVFALDESPWTGSNAHLIEGGDPLTVNAAFAELAQPLGGAVRAGNRSTAIASVMADDLAVRTAAQADAYMEDEGFFSGLIKQKTTSVLARPDRETRLWLPVGKAGQ